MAATFKEAIHGHLVAIDARLSEYRTPLIQRPLRAAIIFVKEYVIEIEGEDKDDYATKTWFAVMHKHIEEWYREHYGDAFRRDDSGFASGVVLIKDIPVELRVPLTRSKVEKQDETAWLIFPVDVGTEENPLAWLRNSPNLEKLHANELAALRKDATEVACALRSIRIYTVGIEPHDEIVSGLSDGVLIEIESAARLLVRNDEHSIGTALWALQMAIERALKAFCQHKSGKFRPIHNLFELFDDAAVHGLTADRNLLKLLPRDKDAIEGRYGLGKVATLSEGVDAFNATLSIVGAVAPLFKRKYTLAGAGILFKRPPWLSLQTVDHSRSADPS